MKTKLLFAVLSNLLISCSVKSEVDLLITGSTVISPISQHKADIKPNHWVAIKDNLVVEVSNSTELPAAKKTVNANGKFLIPGLTDSHTHLKTMPGLKLGDKNAEQMQNAFLQRQGINYLYYGVTQVIDPSNTKQGIADFKRRGLTPDAFFCGAMPIFNGYNARGISHHDLHTQRPYYLAQEQDPITKPEIKNAHSIKQSLKRLAEDGGVCAKVYVEDGFGLANDIPMIAPKKLEELTQRAKSLNLPVMAHANATDMQKIAVHSGVNILGHGLWNWLEEEGMEVNGELPPKVKAISRAIAERNIAYQPTTSVTRSLRDLMIKDHLKQEQYLTVLPDWQIDWYLSDAGQWFAKEMYHDWGGASVEHIVRAFSIKLNNGLRVVKHLYDSGTTIVLGSDTPPAPTYASQPGLASYTEMKTLHQAGIDLEGLLAAATLNNANTYNLSDYYGRVKVGKVANLLLLNSNPLATIEAYDDIDSIILRGQIIKRNQLHINNLSQIAPSI